MNLLAAPIPPGRSAGGRQTSNSLNSNGLLSQKIASSESNGHLPNGNGCASTQQSSECSDEERPGSASGSAKVGRTEFSESAAAWSMVSWIDGSAWH